MASHVQIQKMGLFTEEGRQVVRVEVTNSSPDTTYQLWSGLRALSYDADTQTLHLELAESGSRKPPPGIHVISKHPPKLPRLIPAPPQQTMVLSIPVPSRLRKTSVVDGRLTVYEQPVGPIRHVTCSVAYNEPEAAHPLAEGPEAMRELMREQTVVIRGEADVMA